VEENCEELKVDLSEKLKEMNELNDLMKQKREGPNGSTTKNYLNQMEEQLRVKKGDYKKLEKNLERQVYKGERSHRISHI